MISDQSLLLSTIMLNDMKFAIGMLQKRCYVPIICIQLYHQYYPTMGTHKKALPIVSNLAIYNI